MLYHNDLDYNKPNSITTVVSIARISLFLHQIKDLYCRRGIRLR